MTSSRRDARFIEVSQPAPVSAGFSRQEWDRLVAPYYPSSFNNNLQLAVRNRLGQFGLDPDQPVPTEIETLIRLNLKTLPGLCEAILTLYSLGHPLHLGPLFYPVFNQDTRETIEKKRAFQDYSYKLEYCLIDLIHKSNLELIPVLYRAANFDFAYRVGDTFRFSQFTSSSEDESEARKFFKPGGIMFEIRNARALKMEPYSQYPLEKEYLVHAFDEFKVSKINVYKNETRVVLSKK